MIWALTITAMAAVWLLQRVYTLTRVSVDDLVKALKIEIPRASKVSIDNLTDTKVYLRWDLPAVEQKIVNFVVFLNGCHVVSLSGTESHCCLSGLTANTRYKLDLVSVNNIGYKGKSDPVYIKTKSKELQEHPNQLSLENPDNLFKYLTDSKDSSNLDKLVTPFSVNPNVEGRASRSRSNTVNSLNNDLNLNISSNASMHVAELPDPRSIEDIEELRYHLESGQEELHTILVQQTQTYTDFKDYEATLIQERDSLRERKKLEDGNRQSMKSEITMLDDTRRLTELRKTKQETLLSDRMKNIEKMETDLKLWNEKIEEFSEKKLEMEKQEPIICEQIEKEIEQKQSKIKELNQMISQLDENIKTLSVQKKKPESLQTFTKLFRKLSAHTDDQGFIDSEGIKVLDSIKSLDVEVYDLLKASINTDNKLEAEWRAQQQREVNRCVKLSETYKQLSKQIQQLKESGVQPKDTWDKVSSTPPASNATNSTNSMAQYINSGGSYQVPSPTTHVTNFNYNFSSGSNPSLNSMPNQNNGHSFNQKPTIWNRIQSSSDIQPAQLRVTDLDGFAPGEIDSPSVDHLLPTNLIGEDLSDFLFTKQKEVLTPESSATNPSQELPGSSNFSDTVHIGNPFPNSQFPALSSDSSAKLASKSVFHNDFDISPLAQSNSHIFPAPTSPQVSYHTTDFLSMHNSPVGSFNGNIHDLHSILSGGHHNDFVAPLKLASPPGSQAQSPTPIHAELAQQPLDRKEQQQQQSLNAFSPRRLSNVFSFGKKHNEHNNAQTSSSPNTLTPNTTASKFLQQSKFFGNHKATNSNDSSNDQISSNRNTNGNGHHFFNFHSHQKSDGPQSTGTNDSNFLNSVWDPTQLKIHNRNISLNSTKSIEKDSDSWSNFHNNSASASPSRKEEMGVVPELIRTGDTEENQANYNSFDDKNEASLLAPVELINTNRSSNTTSVKSLKSLSNEANSTGSPSFFRRKSFFSFGTNDKSPLKTAPSNSQVIDTDDSIDELNGGSGSTKRLFSRQGRKSSMVSQTRKQSTSSSYQESQNESMNSNGGRSNSLVNKLNFFKNGKEINEIDEAVEDD